MNCPNCGNIIADGSAMCPICGSSLTQPQGFQQPAYQQPAYQQPAYQGAPKKSNTGLIIGIVIASLVVIAAIVAVLVLVVFKKDDDSSTIPDGKYVVSSMNLEGSTYTQADLSPLGYGNMSLEVEGDSLKFDSTGSGRYAKYTYTYSDGKGHMKGNGEEFDFTYSNNTITIDFSSNEEFSSYSTYTMDFVKQ